MYFYVLAFELFDSVNDGEVVLHLAFHVLLEFGRDFCVRLLLYCVLSCLGPFLVWLIRPRVCFSRGVVVLCVGDCVAEFLWCDWLLLVVTVVVMAFGRV